MNASTKVGIGTPLSRVDGVDKVTGRAKYAAEYAVEGLLYGVAVPARIAKGRIAAIDDTAARAVPGISEVMTHENRPKQAWLDRNWKDELAIPGDPFKALHDGRVLFAGQPVAVVIAETFEAARFAARLVDITYEEEAHNIDFARSLKEKFLPPKGMRRNNYHPPKSRGTRPRRSTPRRCGTRANIISPPSTTIRWRCTPAPSNGTATAASPSTINVRDRRAFRRISRALSGWASQTSASSTPMSAAASDRDCARSGRCSWRQWARC